MQPAWQWMTNKIQLCPTLAPGRSHCSVSRHRLTVCPGRPPALPSLQGLLVTLRAQLLLLPDPQQMGSPWCFLFGKGDKCIKCPHPSFKKSWEGGCLTFSTYVRGGRLRPHRGKTGLHVQTFPRKLERVRVKVDQSCPTL